MRGDYRQNEMLYYMLFYYDLLHSAIGVMSSLFGIVNSIRLLCILLRIYTFYLLFLFGSVKFYILLCNSTFCYADHPRLVFFRNFCILFCVPVLWSVLSRELKLYYAYVISCMALSGQKLDDRAGEWVSFSAMLPFSAIRCRNCGQF